MVTGEGKPIATAGSVSRRKALKLAAGSAAAAVAGLAAPAVIAAGKDKILIGVPSSLSTPYGVADDTDHLNGTTMAVEEINAAGGVLGREIELFVPDVDKLISGKLPSSDRGLYRQKSARDLQRLSVRANPGDGRIRQVQMPIFAGQYAAERDARLQGRPKEVQPGAPDRSVGGQLRVDLPALADQDGADRRLETQEPKDTHRRRAGRAIARQFSRRLES